jgi:hypothetical protein
VGGPKNFYVIYKQKKNSDLLDSTADHYFGEPQLVPATQPAFLSCTEQGIITHISGKSISLMPAGSDPM